MSSAYMSPVCFCSDSHAVLWVLERTFPAWPKLHWLLDYPPASTTPLWQNAFESARPC